MTDRDFKLRIRLESVREWAKCGIHHNHGYNEEKLKYYLQVLDAVMKSVDDLEQKAIELEKQIAQLKKENEFLVEWNDDKNKVDTIEALKNALSIERHLINIKSTQLELKQREIDRLKDDLFTVADPDHPEYKSIKERYNT